MNTRYWMSSLVCAFALCSCGRGSSGGDVGGYSPQRVNSAPRAARLRGRAGQSAIQHVVIIVQENRGVDDLFQFLPGANTQAYGPSSHGNRRIQLQPEPLAAPFDLGHGHPNWVTEYAGGAMNGFDQEQCTGTCPKDAAFSYVPQSDVGPYYTLAETYAFADDFFQSNQGPSFPAHQYLISGTSTDSDGSPNKASSNTSPGEEGGCDSPQGTIVQLITPDGREPIKLRTYPCFKRQSIMNEMDAAGVTWKYYQNKPGAGIWNAVDAISSIWSNPAEMAANVIVPSSQVLTDIANGQLADVVWITPSAHASDHPGSTDGSGPSWVGSIVNAIGDSQYWNDTAIFITWDDWGGFYDHVTPTVYNSYELSFRVPLIVVSPYAKSNFVSHTQYEFGSILKFTEQTFGLPSLNTTDARANDLSDMFDFSKQRMKFKHVRTKYSARHFFNDRSAEPAD